MSNVCVPTESSIAWPEFWVGGSIAAAIATVVSTTGRFRAKLRRRISLAHSSSSVTGTPRALEIRFRIAIDGFFLSPASREEM